MSKWSVALVIRPTSGDRTRWLVVKRPDEDAELPGVWGLPAGSHRGEESTRDLILRIGRDKLGVELLPGPELREGQTDRPAYVLRMSLHEAVIVSGSARVPQGVPDVTQYAAWQWADPAILTDGATRGSLCCTLGLELIETGLSPP